MGLRVGQSWEDFSVAASLASSVYPSSGFLASDAEDSHGLRCHNIVPVVERWPCGTLSVPDGKSSGRIELTVTIDGVVVSDSTVELVAGSGTLIHSDCDGEVSEGETSGAIDWS